MGKLESINHIPGMFMLKNGTKVIQTSGHAAKFSDGTTFNPGPEEAQLIKEFWEFLNVRRDFRQVEAPIPGLKLSTSSQYIDKDDLERLNKFLKNQPDCYILVSFMVISALREMGIRDKYPRLIAGNATKETSRSAPADKIWDIENMAY